MLSSTTSSVLCVHVCVHGRECMERWLKATGLSIRWVYKKKETRLIFFFLNKPLHQVSGILIWWEQDGDIFFFSFLAVLYYNHGALKSLIQTWTWMVFYSKMKYPLWVERKSVCCFFCFFCIFFPPKKIYILLIQNVKARLAVFSSKLQYFLSSNHQLRNGSQS